MVDGRTPSMAGARTGADGYLLPGLDRAQHCAAADLLQLFRVLPRVLSDGVRGTPWQVGLRWTGPGCDHPAGDTDIAGLVTAEHLHHPGRTSLRRVHRLEHP